MNFLNVYRYLLNYVTVSIKGGFTERFINLCNRENVYMWNSVYRNGELTANVFCKDFKKLRGIRKKSGVKIKIIKKCGIYFFIRRNEKRKILIPGICTALLIMLFMNNFIWNIEVTGTKKISPDEIIEMLSESGLKYGTFVPGFDEAQAGREAVNLSDGKILWLAVNIKGSKATVEVRDYVKQQGLNTDNTPCNIVANFDGIILSAYTHTGVQVIQNGSAVKKGDLIISGVYENENGTVDYLCADGEISAICENELKYKKSSAKNKTELVNLKDRYTLKLFGINIPLFLKSDDRLLDKISYTEYLTFDGYVIPIGLEKTTLYMSESASDEEFKEIREIDAFTNREYFKFKNSNIIKADYTISTDKDNYEISGKYSCIHFIGIKSPILKEN